MTEILRYCRSMTDSDRRATASGKTIDSIIAEYEEAEKFGRRAVPNSAIAAFTPEVFQHIGYPHRIAHSQELWRYHDVMQDGRLEQNLLLAGRSMDDELDLVGSAADAIIRFTETNFGFRSAGKDMLSRAVYQYSLLRESLNGLPRPWTVLELGPGCGYLGVLLGLGGHSYIAIEASQAFWVYQSALLRFVFAGEYSDGLRSEEELRIRHVPWWKLCSEGFAFPKLTACTANHMLAEMNAAALVYLSRKLAVSQPVGFKIIAEDLGLCRYNDEHETLRRIVKTGFSATETKSRVWVFESGSNSGEIRRLPKPRRTFRQRLKEAPIVGRAAVSVFKVVGSFSKDNSIDVTARSTNSITSIGAETSSLLATRFERLPAHRSADARFADGSW